MAITIGNNPFLTGTTAALNTSDNTKKLESKLTNNLENATDEELMDVCKSFEAYFVEQMFKEMKKAVPSSDEESPYVSYFGDTLYKEYADNVVETGGMGIAQMLYESMKRN